MSKNTRIIDSEQSAIAYINTLRKRNEDGSVFVTNGLQKVTRAIVRQAKRFYESVYTNNSDQEKLFVPYTKTVVDTMAANLDFDTKDILVTSRQEGKKNIVHLTK